MSLRKKILFTFFFFLILICLLEGSFLIRHWVKNKRLLPYSLASEKTLQQMETWETWESSYTIYHSDFGWTHRPSVEKEKEEFSYRTNAQGLRASQEYSQSPLPGKLRIAFFGDSFIHGDEVAFEDSLAVQFEQKFLGKAESLNFGVSGYGTDQALLMYEKNGQSYQPHVVILGFLTEHIARNVNRFRRFYIDELENPFLSKPRFILNNNQLELVTPTTYTPVEVAQFIRKNELYLLGKDDYFFEPRLYETQWFHHSAFLREWQTRYLKQKAKRKANIPLLYQEEDVLEISVQILKRFAETAKQKGAVPLVITFHFLQDFEKWSEQGHYWKILIERAQKLGVPILDIGEILQRDQHFMQQPSQFFLPQGHYSAKLTKQISDIAYEFLLQQEGFLPLQEKVFQQK